MNNLYNKFEHTFESIFNMKQDKKMMKSTFITYFHYVLSFIIMEGIFIIFGYITSFNDNYIYMTLSLYIAVIGSYMFGRYQQEENYMKHHDLQYDIRYAISVDVLQFTTITTSVTAILLVLVYSVVVNLFTILLFVILATLLFILMLFLSEALRKFKIIKLHSIIINIILIHQFYLIGFNLYLIGDIVWNTLFWTGILAVLIIVRNITGKRDIPVISNPTIKFILYAVVLIWGNNSIPRLNYEDYNTNEYFIKKVSHSEQISEIKHPSGGYFDELYETKYTSDYIFLITEYEVFAYTYDYEHAGTYTRNDNQAIDIQEDDGKVYIYKVQLHRSGDVRNYVHTLYELDDYAQEQLVFETDSLNSSYYDIYIDDGRYYLLDDNIREYIPETDQLVSYKGDEEVIYINEQNIFIPEIGILNTSVGYDPNIAYSNGYIMEQYETSVKLYTLDDYLKNKANGVAIKVPTTEITTSDREKHVDSFIVTDNHILIKAGLEVFVYNKDLELENYSTYLTMKSFNTSSVDGDIITNINQTYYDSFGGGDTIYVNQVNTNDFASYQFRTSFTSFISCTNPYGCDDLYRVHSGVFIYIELWMITLVFVAPRRKTPFLQQTYQINS